MNIPTAIEVSSPESHSQHRKALWLVLFQKASSQDQVAFESLGGSLGPHGLNASVARKIIRAGISSDAIGPLGAFLGLGKGVVADYLDLDRSTANRRSASGKPLPTHSAEGFLRLLEVETIASDTFDTLEDSKRWLHKAHPLLDGETPLEAAKTSYGAQQVKDILVAIKYGGVV